MGGYALEPGSPAGKRTGEEETVDEEESRAKESEEPVPEDEAAAASLEGAGE